MFNAPARKETAAKAVEPPPETTRPPPVETKLPDAPSPPTAPAIASGAKTKARDIIAAIRTLQTIEREQRPATHDERDILARFGGFGAVALSLFPDPVTGRYKDAGWQVLGDELKALLSPEEYDAKRTTFNAFYTSPIVIDAIHQAVKRLGVPDNATVLEPGCGTGNFLARPPRAAVHRRRTGFHLRPHRPRAASQRRHPHREFPRYETPRRADRRGDRQPAVCRRAARLSRPEAAAA